MSSKLKPQERLKLIERVILGGEPVARVCRQAGISRVLFYRWLKRYKEAPGTLEVLVPGKPRIMLTSSRGLRLHPQGVRMRGKILSPEEKLALIKRVEAGEEVADICREAGISRTIFYRWKERYEKALPEEKLQAVAPRVRQITRYWRQVPEKYEQAVLNLVIQHPEYGIRKLVAHLPQVAGVPIVGHHGVQNILRRHNLSLYEQRLAYAQAQVTPFIRFVGAWKQAFARFFVFSVETRQAIVRFVGTTVLSLFTTVLVLGILGYFATVFGQAAPVLRPGLIFASVALFVGMIFFAYSMKYYFTLALVLSFSTQTGGNGQWSALGGENGQNGNGGWLGRIFGLRGRNGSFGGANSREVAPYKVPAGGLQPNLDHIKLERYPFISVHLPFYNEKKVANRILSACTSFDYPNYEVIVCDDSTDETVKIVKEWEKHPKVKVLHRSNREGFKGGALREALKHMDPKTEFVIVFDADFIPYPDTLTQFVKYFKATGGWQERTNYQVANIQTMPYETFSKVEISTSTSSVLERQEEELRKESNIAVVAGYQWHVLNKSENWITRGVRTEYAGSYVIERPGQEILGALKIIHGSVYCIRADVLKHFGWGTSITEDFELTLRLYEKGFKVVYTPYVQAPSECVSTLKRLIRQRMRWAEGHSFNVRKMFFRLLFGHWADVGDEQMSKRNSGQTKGKRKVFIPSPLTLMEKLEFLYLSPYYLQAFFFLIGTFSWLISETVFPARLPFWTSLWGWSLVLTNFFALPLVNAVGLFLEESEEKDYLGILSFVALSYLLVPFQAYASVKGFLEKEEGPWFRTPKTGLITDIFTRGRFYRWITGILPGFRPATGGIVTSRLTPDLNPYLNLATANNRFNHFRIWKRYTKGFVALVMALLLFVSSSLNFLASGIAMGKERELTATKITIGANPPAPSHLSFLKTKKAYAQRENGMVTTQYTPKNHPQDFFLENPSKPGVYDTPYIFRQVDTYHYQVFMKSKNGVMRYDFDRDGIHLAENRGSGFIDLVTGSWFRFQYYQGGTWNNATYNLSTIEMGKTEPGDGTITLWIQANFNEVPTAFARMEMKLGFDGQKFYHKITARQPDVWSGALSRRVYWDLRVTPEVANYIKNTIDDYQIEGVRPKHILLGEIIFDWGEVFDMEPRIALNKEERTARIWFYERGTTGDIVIDPTMSTTVTTSTITITSDRYKAVVGNNNTWGIIEYYNPPNDTTNWVPPVPEDISWFLGRMEDATYTSYWYDALEGGTRGTDWDVELLEDTPTRVVIRRWGSWDYIPSLNNWWTEDYFIFYPEYIMFTWRVWRASGSDTLNRWDVNAHSRNMGSNYQYRVGAGNWTNSPTNNLIDINREDTYSNYRENGTSSTRYIGLVHRDTIANPPLVDSHGGNYYGSWAWMSVLSSDYTPATDTKAWFLMVNDDTDQSTELAGVDSDFRNPDDLSDGLTTGSGWFDADERTASSTDFYNEDELTYNLIASGSQVQFDIDGGTYTRYRPTFKIRAYRTINEPSSVTLEGSSLSSGTDYNTDLANFSEAWVYDSDGSGYKKLADGGDTGDSDEYLNDSADNFNFGDATYTFGDSSGDYFYLGSHDQFTGVNLDLSTVGAGTANIQWQYCSANSDEWSDCDTWTNLSVSDTDSNAQHLRASGNFYFTDPSSWARARVNSGRPLWWIRGYVSSGSYTTYPVERTIRTDILLFQYLSNISSNDQTFVIVPENLWAILPLLPILADIFPRLKERRLKKKKR